MGGLYLSFKNSRSKGRYDFIRNEIGLGERFWEEALFARYFWPYLCLPVQ